MTKESGAKRVCMDKPFACTHFSRDGDMGWIHPVLLFFVMLGGLYVLWLGWFRFRALHMSVRVPFQWKRHVRFGTLVLLIWVVAPALGLTMAKLLWNVTFITGAHAWVGIAMAVLAALGYASGLLLDKVKKRRTWLPLAHGINNVVLVALSLWQAWTGWGILPLL